MIDTLVSYALFSWDDGLLFLFPIWGLNLKSIQDFIEEFGVEKIEVLVADREFVSKE